MSSQFSNQDGSTLNVPHKVHHFVTGKTLIMFVAFVATLGIAVGSYIYLLNKTHQTPQTTRKSNASLDKKSTTLADPQEFTDGVISFFYPGSMLIDTKSDMSTGWKIKSSDGSYITNALILTKQTAPFTEPQNGDTNHTATQYFSIDDIQARYINNLTVKEYTVNCGIDCDYRLNQFQVETIYYQLYFDTSRPGLSSQAEQILATLKLTASTPSPTCRPRPACLDATPRCMIPETEDMCPRATPTEKSNNQVFCTMDAKVCPDGSSVGRIPPSCEFAACPN